MGQQVPAYVEYEDKLKEAGVDKVFVYCVNDPAVMMAWAKDQGVEIYGESSGGFVTFLSDADGSFTDACAMEMVHPGPYGVGILGRCKRWAFYAKKGVLRLSTLVSTRVIPPVTTTPRSPCPRPWSRQ